MWELELLLVRKMMWMRIQSGSPVPSGMVEEVAGYGFVYVKVFIWIAVPRVGMMRSVKYKS